MRGVRFKKDEREAIIAALERYFDADDVPLKVKKAISSAEEKMRAALEPKEAGPNAGALERTLILAARGKIVQVTSGGAVYARISKLLAQYNITEDQMICVGRWLASQKWLTGPLTILTVLAKWPDWSARAKQSAPPQGAPEGLGGRETGNVRPGADGGSQTTAPGRPTPGFR